MNANKWTPVLIVSLLTFGSVQAFADGDPYYDEDIDAVSFTYVGNTATHSTSQFNERTIERAGSWFYDEDIDPIAFDSTGSRSDHTRTSSPIKSSLVGVEQAYLDQ